MFVFEFLKKIKNSSHCMKALFLGLVILFAGFNSFGQTSNYEWNGAAGTTDWDTDANWVGGAAPGIDTAAEVTILNTAPVMPVISGSSSTVQIASLVIPAGSSLTIDNSLSITGAVELAGQIDSSSTGQVEFGGSVTCGGGATLGCDFSFNGGSITFPGTDFNIYASNIDLNNCAAFTMAPAGKLIFHNDVEITKTDEVTFSSPVEGSGNIKITADFNTTNDASLTVTGNLVITGGAQFRGNITASSLQVGGNASLCGNLERIETSGNQEYNGDTELLRTASPVVLVSTAGKVIFGNEIRNWYGVSETRDLTIGETSNPTDVEFRGIVGKRAGTADRIGKIQIFGNMENAAVIRCTDISVSGTSSIGANIDTTGTQTFSDAVTLKGDINLSAGTSLVKFEGTVDSDTTSRALTIGGAAAATPVEFDGAVGGIKPPASLTVYGTSTINYSITTAGVQTYNGAVTNAGTINVPSLAAASTAVEFKGGLNGSGVIAGSTVTDPDIVFSGTGAVKFGTLTQNGDVVKFTGACDVNPNSQSLEDVVISPASGNVKFTTALECDNVTIDSGTLLSGANVGITVHKNWTNNAGADGYKYITSGTVIFDNASDASVIAGDTTFSNLTCVTAGKTLTFTAGSKQTVNGKLTVTGTAAAPVVLHSSADGSTWEIDAAVTGTNKASVTYAAVKDSVSARDSIEAVTSFSHGNNTNWIIAGTYVWTGTQDTVWAKESNWKVLNLDGVTYSQAVLYPGQIGKDDIAIVPDSSAASNRPVFSLPSDIIISTLTIETDAASVSALTLDAAGNIRLSKTPSPLLNEAIIEYQSTGRIKNNMALSAAISDNAHGTVVFNGTDLTVDDINTGSDDYYNLVIKNSSSLLGTEIKVANDFTVETTGSIDSGNALSITGKSSIGGNITTSGNQNFTGAVTLKNDVTLIAKAKQIAFSNTVNSDAVERKLFIGDASNKTDCNSNAVGNTSKLSELYVNGNFEVGPEAGKEIKVNGPIKILGTAIFRGDVTASQIDIDGNVTYGETTGKVTTTGTQTYGASFISNRTRSDADKVLEILAGSNDVTITGEIRGYLNAGVVTNPNINFGNASQKTNLILKNKISEVKALHVFGKTTFKDSASSVVTAGDQIYDGLVTLDVDTTFTQKTGSEITVYLKNAVTSTVTPVSKALTLSSKDVVFGVTGVAGFTHTAGIIINGSLVQIFDSNVFERLTVNSPGNSVTFEAGKTQTVNTSLTLKGAAGDGNLLELKSSASGSDWKIDYLNTSISPVLDYLKVSDSYNESPSLAETYLFTATNSTDNENNYHWNFLGQLYTWTGAADTNWYEKTNWLPKSIPGHGSKVKIPDCTSITNKLKLESAVDISYAEDTTIGSFTVEEKGEVDFYTYDFDVNAISNSGHIKADGSNTVTYTSVTNEAGSTVEYYGTIAVLQTERLPFGNAYKNLYFSNGANGSVAAALTINEGLAIANGATRNLVLSGANVFAPAATDAVLTKIGITSPAAVTGGNIEINSNGSLVLEKAADCSSLKISGNAKINGNVTTTGNQVYENQITLNGSETDFEFKSTGASSSVVFGTASGSPLVYAGSILGAGKNLKLNAPAVRLYSSAGTSASRIGKIETTTNASAIEISQNVFAKELLIEEAGSSKLTINASQINTTDSQNYKCIVDSNNGLTLTSKNVTVHKAWTADDGITVSLTDAGLLKTYASGDITLASGKKFSQNISGTGTAKVMLAGDLITSDEGTITFAGDVYLYTDGDTAMTLGGGEKITLSENLYAAASGKTINVSSPLSAKNIVLMNGTLSLTDGMTTTQDIVLLNGNPSTMYNESAAQGISGVANLLTYLRGHSTNPFTASQIDCIASSLSELPASFPDAAETFPSLYEGVLSASGNTIISGQNFYDNGVNLQGISLTVKGNENQTDAFAECHKAVITNVAVTGNGGANAYLASSEGSTDGGGNTNVFFTRPLLLVNDITKTTMSGGTAPETPNLSGTYTVYDDVIRIEFIDSDGASIKIENSNNEISRVFTNADAKLSYNGGTNKFTGTYIDADCTVSTDGKGDLAVFYVKGEARWNTDATGNYSGNADSTDCGRSSADAASHRNVKTDVKIPKALTAVFATLRDEHKNRIADYSRSAGDGSGAAGKIFDATSDRCSPVLVEVLTGQELHINGNSTVQKTYDSHNFIELHYSEPVDIGSLTYDGGAENKKAETAFTAAANYGGAVTNTGVNGLNIAGYVNIASGRIDIGSRTRTNTVTQNDPSASSVYRKFTRTASDAVSGTESAQPCRVRFGIASYVDGTVTVNGASYHFWPGFIDSANSSMPSGNITRIGNNYIVDKSTAVSGGNILSHDRSSTVNHKLPQLTVNSTESELYGVWDLVPPDVARYVRQGEWASDSGYKEILSVDPNGAGYTTGFELHLFDNLPLYTSMEEYKWVSRLGWYENGSGIFQSEAPLDQAGGARFNPADSSRRTKGGIRISSIYNSMNAFRAYNETAGVSLSLTGEFAQKTTVDVFFGTSGSLVNDTNYLTFKINGNASSLTSHNYNISYDTVNGFITDLAGNRLKKFDEYKTPDKNPPHFSLSLAKNGGNELYVLFSKQIQYLDANGILDNNAVEYIVRSIKLETAGGVKLIDYDNGSRIRLNTIIDTPRSTGMIITLADGVLLTYEDLKTLKFGVNTWNDPDPVSGTSGWYSRLYDKYKNPIPASEEHRITDFLLDVIDVQYAYDGRNEQDAIYGNGIFGEGEWTVRDFTGSGHNTNRVLENKDITIVTKVCTDLSGDPVTDKFVMHLDKNPTPQSVGDNYQANSTFKTRMWIPTDLEAFASVRNTSSDMHTLDFETYDSGNDNGIRKYVLPNAEDTPGTFNWKNGVQGQFMFEIKNEDGSPYPNAPLYAARLRDSSDIRTIDLWSLDFARIIAQRGGVTILNNVIDVNVSEQTVIQVEMPSEGNLNVIVMTADGNIVKYLQHGRTEAGTHYYYWDGKNNGGNPVARGIYFVRVVGPDIDETRKVMCVKN